jgi:hypothetical protein
VATQCLFSCRAACGKCADINNLYYFIALDRHCCTPCNTCQSILVIASARCGALCFGWSEFFKGSPRTIWARHSTWE